MNHLAHLYLSAGHPDEMAGNLLGDFVRGRPEGLSLPEPLMRGVKIHRRIDSFSDGHPATLQARRCFPAPYRRYAGIVLDVVNDYLLTRHWSEFCRQPLPLFADRAYAVLRAREGHFPPAARAALHRLIAADWLTRYATLDDLSRSLERLQGRLSRSAPLAEAFEAVVGPAPEQFEAGFFDLFRAVGKEVAAHRKSLTQHNIGSTS